MVAWLANVLWPFKSHENNFNNSCVSFNWIHRITMRDTWVNDSLFASSSNSTLFSFLYLLFLASRSRTWSFRSTSCFLSLSQMFQVLSWNAKNWAAISSWHFKKSFLNLFIFLPKKTLNMSILIYGPPLMQEKLNFTVASEVNNSGYEL